MTVASTSIDANTLMRESTAFNANGHRTYPAYWSSRYDGDWDERDMEEEANAESDDYLEGEFSELTLVYRILYLYLLWRSSVPQMN